MKKIGFQNFRRFLDFKPLEYKGITFLVGRNNAGKSTLVKAILLVEDYFKSKNVSKFSFGNKAIEDANIVTYGRAKNRKATNNFINFYYEVDKYYVEIVLSGDDDKTYANVHNLLIIDRTLNLNFHIQPIDNSITIFKGNVLDDEIDDQRKSNIKILNNEIKRVQSLLDSSNLKKSSKEYILLVEELDTLQKKRILIAHNSSDKKSDNLYLATTHFNEENNIKEIVDFAITSFIIQHNLEFPEIQNGKTPSEKFSDYRGIKEDEKIISESFDEFYNLVVKWSSIIYLGANSAKQSALFPIRDRNNSLSQAIHDFFQLKITPGEHAYEFVKKWMKTFEVGDDFEIVLHAGEAYEVGVFSNDTKIHLADKGMGSIQAMLLILRLGTIIHKWSNSDQIITVIIEEPELNLHPALQSKLAELFLEVHEKFLINLLVETHSEYILRRSQVLVAENEFEIAPNENPFCVHYFPKEMNQMPYRLEYLEDGSFNRNFGDGFFDEASVNTLELLRLKRQKKA